MITPLNRKTLVSKLIICLIPIISVKLAQNSKGCHNYSSNIWLPIFFMPTISHLTVMILLSSSSYYAKK